MVSGKWYWYTKRPSANNSIVWHVGGDCKYGRIKNCPLPDAEWQVSLIERPNPVTVDSGVWSLVPDNARYVAMDKNKKWHWYEGKVTPVVTQWLLDDFCAWAEIENCPLNSDIDWTQSLIERPQTTPNKPPHAPKPFDWSVPIRK